MPVCVAQTVQKVAVRSATVCHDGYLVSVASPPHAPGCTASRHVRLEWSQSDTLVDELERGQQSSSLPRQASCRGRPGKLLLPGPCLLEWPLQQAPLAVAFVLW